MKSFVWFFLHPVELIPLLSLPLHQNIYKEANKNSMATSYSLPSDTPLIKQVKLNSTVASNVSPPATGNTDVALSGFIYCFFLFTIISLYVYR